MAIDTPAKLAILGAGPIGLEAALYARFLGYDVILLEQGRICEHVLRWGHAKLLTPFSLNRSPLGLAAIEAQDENYHPPADETLLTGNQWFERYLLPLAETDLLSEHIFPNTRVLGVGKEQVQKTDLEPDLPDDDERGDWPFRILVRDAEGVERIEMVDGVLDCTGTYSNPNYAGHGGLPAVGEIALRDQLVYHLPDLLEADRAPFENQRTLLIGDGVDAAAAAVLLDELQQQSPATQFVWITGHETEPAGGPITIVREDMWQGFGQLKTAANRIARETQAWQWGTHLEQVQKGGNGKFAVTLSGQLSGAHEFDRILALVGYRSDNSLYAELQIGINAIAGGKDHTQARESEANYYILGSKFAGRNSQCFTFDEGLQQIREVFARIGDRPMLDLYAEKPKLD